MVMVHVKVVEEVTDIVDVVSVLDKHEYKVYSDLQESRFSRILLKFHFSISISRHFYFTSRFRFPVISISLSFLEKSERGKN